MIRRRRPSIRPEDLPEAHQQVLLILADAKRSLSWEELRSRAADVGIDEEELCLVMFGTRTPPQG